jgi:aminoglycoside phosphotransferase (APT) family kinase protein
LSVPTQASSANESPRLAALVESRLESVYGTRCRVESLRSLPGGASRELWAVHVDITGQGTTHLVLRRDPPAEPRPDEIAQEANAIRAAGAHGVPVPKVIDWSSDPAVLDAPYLLMTFVNGETIARRILRDEHFAHARPVLTGQLGRAAAAIHKVPASSVPAIPERDALAALRDRYEATGVRRAVLELAFQWLEANRPPKPPQPTLVHGDYRLGNVIVDDRGLAAVLDWELTHLGDPMEDLGYLSIRAWRFGGPKPVAGIGDFHELFAAYADESGIWPDPDVVHWWQVEGTLFWGVICLYQANRHLTGTTRSVEFAAIGRRVAEQEFDLLRMLCPGSDSGSAGTKPA